MVDTGPTVSRRTIVDGLLRLGLGPGCGLVVHSSLSSFGMVEGGADAVIDALVEVVTPEGTILMPSFNHDAPFRAGGAGVYDPQTTPTSNGAIPDRFWRRQGVVRSLNPTHPFAALGRRAYRYTRVHHRTLTMGSGSPLGLLLEDDGYTLLLGVGFNANTFHHVVEMSTGAPCLGQRTEAYPVQLADGRRVEGRTWGWRAGSCPLTDGRRYEAVMAARGLYAEANIGACPVILFRLQDCYDVVAEILRRGMDGYPPCAGCAIRPRTVRATVASDWDSQGQLPVPSSSAWRY